MAFLAIMLAALLDPITAALMLASVFFSLKASTAWAKCLWGAATFCMSLLIMSWVRAAVGSSLIALDIIAAVIWAAVFCAWLLPRQLRIDRSRNALPKFTQEEIRRIDEAREPWMR